jgi:putative aldouronate transport system substrate-binding protein
MQIRTNWLENLKLDPPETLDDWYKVLTAFKEQDANGNGDPNDEIPFVPRGGNNNLPDMMQFGLPYKVSGHDFYLYDGKIGYGPYAPELKDVRTLLNKWYNEGLIDPITFPPTTPPLKRRYSTTSAALTPAP